MDQGSFAYKMVVFRINNTDIFMQLILVYFPTFSRFLLAKSYKLIKFKSRGRLQGNKLIPRRRAIRISDNLGNSVLCSRLDSNNFAADPPPPIPLPLEWGQWVRTQLFSEHGHVAFQI